jgi:hypothetical protein
MLTFITLQGYHLHSVSASLVIKETNNLFSGELGNSYSFPFEVSLDEQAVKAIAHLSHVHSTTPRFRKLYVEVFFQGVYLYNGILNIHEVDYQAKLLKVNLNVGLGNLKEFGEQLLTQQAWTSLSPIDDTWNSLFINSLTYSNYSANTPTPNMYGCVFAPIFNPLQEENKVWRGSPYVNEYNSTTKIFNVHPTENRFSPCIYLDYILQHMLYKRTKMATNVLRTNDNLRRLVHCSFKNFITDTTNVIDLRHYLPKIKVSSLLQSLRHLFGLSYVYAKDSLHINFISNILEAEVKHDWTDKTIFLKQQFDIANRFSFKMPLESSWVEKHSPVNYEYSYENRQTVQGEERKLSSDNITVPYGIQNVSWCTPAIYAYQASENEHLNLLYYRGLQPDYQGINYPMLSASNRNLRGEKIGECSLFFAKGYSERMYYPRELNGDEHLAEIYYQRYFDFHVSTRKMEAQVSLNLTDLVNLHLHDKVHIGGADYIVESLSYQLPITEPAKVSLWRV